HDKGVGAVGGPTADEIDQLQLVPLPNPAVLEVLAAPDLPVVLDHHSRRLHVELFQKLEQGQPLRHRSRFPVQRDVDLLAHTTTLSRASTAARSIREAPAGSGASYTARTTATARAPASRTWPIFEASIPPIATAGSAWSLTISRAPRSCVMGRSRRPSRYWSAFGMSFLRS